jgi:hypothetical protein
MRELRAMFKQKTQWFEVPKPGSNKGQNAVDYSIELVAQHLITLIL